MNTRILEEHKEEITKHIFHITIYKYNIILQ